MTTRPPEFIPLDRMASIPNNERRSNRLRRLAIATWAMFGVTLLFVESILRLGARALATITSNLDGPHWLALGGVVALFCYGEGYRGLQCRFAPVVVARSLVVGSRTPGIWVVAAPLYALALVGGSRRERARAWLGTALIVAAALIVRALPLQWRGIVDAGVATALLWGLVALLSQFGRSVCRSRR